MLDLYSSILNVVRIFVNVSCYEKKNSFHYVLAMKQDYVMF